MTTLSIKMEQYGERGWTFSVTRETMGNAYNNWTPGPQTDQYRTSSDGDGLWHLQPSGVISVDEDGKQSAVWEYRQIEGTCQFSLPADRKRAYSAIRRAWAPEVLA